MGWRMRWGLERGKEKGVSWYFIGKRLESSGKNGGVERRKPFSKIGQR